MKSCVTREEMIAIVKIKVTKEDFITGCAHVGCVECDVCNTRTGDSCSVGNISVEAILLPPGDIGLQIMVIIARW